MCQTKNRHHGNQGSERCGCIGEGRRYFTKEERLERMEKYREDLEKELVAIKEAIHELKG